MHFSAFWGVLLCCFQKSTILNKYFEENHVAMGFQGLMITYTFCQISWQEFVAEMKLSGLIWHSCKVTGRKLAYYQLVDYQLSCCN